MGNPVQRHRASTRIVSQFHLLPTYPISLKTEIATMIRKVFTSLVETKDPVALKLKLSLMNNAFLSSYRTY
ncbi:hypothetical protein VNO77_15573 [Canavalia gladiata]|uniref:Uncharacterized protein n=1 Tax=Canavalia gladiata TaxID=3824 RepID=A0AAN9LZN8_CANGL